MQFILVSDQGLVFSVLGIVLVFVCIQCRLLVGLQCCGISQHCITVLGVAPGLFDNHWEWVSGSLEGVMRVPLHELVALLCSAYRVFSCSLPLLGSPPFCSLFFTVLKSYYCSSISQSHVLGLGQVFPGRWGSWLSCKQGRLLGVLATWFWGQQFQPPRSLAPDFHMRQRHPTSLCNEVTQPNW